MRLFLDTHVLLWWLQDNPRLGPVARSLIADGENDILISVASPWEISVKHRTGKMTERGSAILAALASEEMELVPLTADHLAALEQLPPLHRDPFDHLILAQAQAERAAIITSDEIMPRYGIPCIGVT